MAILASNDEKKQQTTTTTTTQTTQAPQQSVTPADNGVVKATPIKNTQNTTQSGYDKAMKTLQAAEYTAPSFSSDYDQTINDLYTKITSREPFKYDYSTDPLYGQYREQYVQQGKQAMKDTMGQAAALTGGYGSSYGQAVGQQQYDAYLQRLNDVLPDLYKTAFDVYQAEGDQMSNQFNMANTMRNAEYGQFRDAVGDRQYQQAMDIQEAENRAQFGDFSGYAALYGQEAADNMAKGWNASNPDLAYRTGNITPKEYRAMTGKWPAGYTPPSSGGGGGYYGPANDNRSQLEKDIAEAKAKGMNAGDINGMIVQGVYADRYDLAEARQNLQH